MKKIFLFLVAFMIGCIPVSQVQKEGSMAPHEVIMSPYKALVKETIASKRTVHSASGPYRRSSFYNMEEGGCHKVTIEEIIDPFPEMRRKHFKMCGNSITEEKVFELMIFPHEDKNAQFIYDRTLEDAFMRGEASNGYAGYAVWTVKAHIAKDTYHNDRCRLMAVFVYQDGYLIERAEKRVCK